MMLDLYFTLGIFLLLAVRNPSANRGVIAFAVVEFCSRLGYGRHGNPPCERTLGLAGCRGGVWFHRCNSARAGSSEAVGDKLKSVLLAG